MLKLNSFKLSLNINTFKIKSYKKMINTFTRISNSTTSNNSIYNSSNTNFHSKTVHNHNFIAAKNFFSKRHGVSQR